MAGVHNHDSYLSEMPGSAMVPNKTAAWRSPSLHGEGGGVNTAEGQGGIMSGYEGVQQCGTVGDGGGGPVPVEGHLTPGYDEVQHVHKVPAFEGSRQGHGDGGGGRMDIV